MTNRCFGALLLTPRLRPVVLLLSALLPLGCGSGSGPTKPRPADLDWPENALRLPDADAAAARAARARYLALREGLAPDAARTALLAELNGDWPGIAAALLGSDETSFTLRFADGATALLVTDEAFGSPPPDNGKVATPTGSGAGARRPGHRAPAPRARAAADRDCDDIVIPSNHKAKIINLSVGPYDLQTGITDETYQALLEHGWDAEDITVVQSTQATPFEVTPDELTDLSGYGMVVAIGQTASVTDVDGTEHTALQCFDGGSYADGWSEHVAPLRWDQYERWQEEGRLVTCYSAMAFADSVPQVYVRDDLLREQTTVDEGAIVTLIGNNTDELFDEYSASGAGGVTGWDGPVWAYKGVWALEATLDAMTSEDGASLAESVAQVRATPGGRDWETWDGEQTEFSYLTASDGATNAILPAWGTARVFEVLESLPEGATRVQVTLSSEDCPELDYTYQMHPDSLGKVDGIVPGHYSGRVLVFDDSGALIAAGNTRELLSAGYNGMWPSICWSDATLTLGQMPTGVNAPASLHVELVGEGGRITAAFDLASGSPAPMSHLIPADYVVTVTARDGAGNPLGRHQFRQTLQCGDNPMSTCLGWLELETGTLAPEIVGLDVTVASAFSGSRTVRLVPGQALPVIGLAVGEAVSIDVVARDAHEEPVASFSHPIEALACGPTTVILEALGYGILLEATPHKLPADGASVATVVATARLRRAGDLLEPTGDPVTGLQIDLDTSCGTFLGAASGTTDADGKVTAQLVSDSPCVAVVHALNEADAVQSRPTYVNFGARLSFWINGSGAPVASASLQGSATVSCAQIRFTLRDYLMSEPFSALENGLWGVYVPNNTGVGETVSVSFTRWAENSLCEGGAAHAVGPVWVHTAYLPDLEHQRAYQLTSGAANLGSVSYSVTFEEIEYYAGEAAARLAAAP